MAVYVDSMRAEFRGQLLCHMLADSDAELHAMAECLGMPRRLHQKPGPGSHYDIPMPLRDQALALGALPISWKQASAMVMRRRQEGRLGAPEEAVAWARAEFARRRLSPDPAVPQS